MIDSAPADAVAGDPEVGVMPWWGHSKEHGWVVLDRSLASNTPGHKRDLMFVRCRDTTIFMEKRERWIPPGYRFAPNYIRALAPAESGEAATEFEALQARWPEFEREIKRVCQEADDQAESVRVEEEKSKKDAAAAKKKLVAAVKATP